MTTPVKIAWRKHATVPLATPLAQGLTPAEYAVSVARTEAALHPSYQVAEDIFVEVPDPAWRHGDLLIYLPRRGWLVRTNYRGAWYVDMGVFKPLANGLYNFTDLWLDVIMPEPATTYDLVDADEFAAALHGGQVSPELAAYAMESLHALLELVRAGQFPPPEVQAAREFTSPIHRSDSKPAP